MIIFHCSKEVCSHQTNLCSEFLQPETLLQEPKKNFFQMAVRGARDNLGGALASAVWGRQIPLGSGADFKVVPNPVSYCVLSFALLARTYGIYAHVNGMGNFLTIYSCPYYI